MKDGWTDRLWIAIQEDGRSDRAISLEAGLGANYLGQTRKRESSPVSDKLNAILDVLGESAAIFVMTGVRITPEGIRAINAISNVPEHLRENAMSLLLALSDESSLPEDLISKAQQISDPEEAQAKPEKP
nr:hypothetical protein [uncultured Celeribacter sp.]